MGRFAGCAGLAVHNVERHFVEAGDKWLKRRAGTFDRVLVDAPCTGTGTWRRNPDARLRLKETDLAELLPKQASILDKAQSLVRKGGRLVYATCSLLEEENEAQVTSFLLRHADFAVVPLARAWPLDQPPPNPGDFLSLTPARHGTDGFFVAVLERSRDFAAQSQGGRCHRDRRGACRGVAKCLSWHSAGRVSRRDVGVASGSVLRRGDPRGNRRDCGDRVGGGCAGWQRAPDYWLHHRRTGASRGSRRQTLAEGEVETLYVLDDWRERGVGRRLMRAAAGHLVDIGCRSAFLWVLRDNPSRWFYQRLAANRSPNRPSRSPVRRSADGICLGPDRATACRVAAGFVRFGRLSALRRLHSAI